MDFIKDARVAFMAAYKVYLRIGLKIEDSRYYSYMGNFFHRLILKGIGQSFLNNYCVYLQKFNVKS